MSRRRIPVILLAVLLLLSLSLAIANSEGVEEPVQYPPLILPQASHVLFVLPHPDDETLPSGGLVSDLAKQGVKATFLYLTNGESFQWAAQEELQKFLLSPQDYLEFGILRQQEPRAALAELGYPKAEILFLGYPDKSLEKIWLEHWSAQNPLVSPELRTSISPYENSFHPHQAYAGENILEDLKEVLRQQKPDLIFAPTALDSHADHWATYGFLSLALEEMRLREGTPPPPTFLYLVHRGDWPNKHGKELDKQLPPPKAMRQIGTWMVYPLSPEAQAAKERAITCYRTQRHLGESYIYSFIRANELFLRLDTPPLDGKARVLEPTEDTFWRKVLGGADFSALTFAWDQGLRTEIEMRTGWPTWGSTDLHLALVYQDHTDFLAASRSDLSTLPSGSSLVREGPLFRLTIPLAKRPQAILASFASYAPFWVDRTAIWLLGTP